MAIAEGLKLASRVDGLRETTAREENALEKFRVETLSNIGDQIQTEEEKRNALKEEVKVLEERRVLALAPLVERETAITTKEAVLASKKAELKALNDKLVQKDMDSAKTENVALEKLGLAKVVHTQASATLLEASTIKANAEQTNRLAAKTLKEAEANATVLLAHATEQAQLVKDREEAVAKREEDNRQALIDIAKEWTKLHDYRATIDRNLKRK